KLEHGKPLIFGRDRSKGIRLRGIQLEVVELNHESCDVDLLVHDAKAEEPVLTYMLARMDYPEFPVPIGVFRSVAKPSYDELLEVQVEDCTSRMGTGDLDKLLNSGETWVIE